MLLWLAHLLLLKLLRWLLRVPLIRLLLLLVWLIRLLLVWLIHLLLALIVLLLEVLARALHTRHVTTSDPIDHAAPPLPLLLKVGQYGTLLMGTHDTAAGWQVTGPMLIGRGYGRVAVVIRLLIG